MKINKIAIVSKLGSKKAEKAVKGIAAKLAKTKIQSLHYFTSTS
uniref:Uncharacterized protein n=2 Tax=environmental samples TaxID=651140 RepID=A0A075I8G6_9ARCH|nr:hypothetical protein [uncultured marine thaumarchaeote SAT1000_25_G11]AIF24193.1 hypothetical protein [uncultured marine thaumarchaeote SAT1000_25_G12]